MTNKEIAKKAHSIFYSTWSECIALHLHITIILFLLLSTIQVISLLVKGSFSLFDIVDNYVPQSTQRTMGIMVISVVVLLLYVPVVYMLRRYYINLITGDKISTAKQYFMHNISSARKAAVSCLLTTTMLRAIVLIPALLSSYMVYRCAFVSRLENLNTMILILFMLALGFTLVWSVFWVKYCIGLSLTKFIITLSPKMNIFDACDLSQKIMDANITRYLSFWAYNIRYIIPCAMIFPSCVFVPYIRLSYTVFVKDLLGSYWQDKYPIMIERWQRRATHI